MVALNAAEGWSQDVSEGVAAAVIDRVYDADDDLTDGTKRFLDRHLGLERRPPAPSVMRAERFGRKQPA